MTEMRRAVMQAEIADLRETISQFPEQDRLERPQYVTRLLRAEAELREMLSVPQIFATTRQGDARYGKSVSDERWDLLDIQCVRDAAWCRERHRTNGEYPPLFVDLGCGNGLMALTMHDLGCGVIACDLQLPSGLPQALRQTWIRENTFARDMRDIPWMDLRPADIVYSQRALHYIPYQDAVALLTSVSRKPGCGVYLSLAGYNSPLAHGYPHLRKPVQERFVHPAPEPGGYCDINVPLALYTPDDARRLVTEAGLTPVDSWESEFGNVKITAVRQQDPTAT